MLWMTLHCLCVPITHTDKTTGAFPFVMQISLQRMKENCWYGTACEFPFVCG